MEVTTPCSTSETTFLSYFIADHVVQVWSEGITQICVAAYPYGCVFMWLCLALLKLEGVFHFLVYFKSAVLLEKASQNGSLEQLPPALANIHF